ncbi:uncharacterized protein LOC121467357 [Drosophila elegans]|uniref:uncharacterized protein LOC121467350 n=1 Tax=Drosophila elegans TaxID=30023 RepID=UPI001BC861EA|nr:uncharacterized protein LOC121467350 [Drosophila elegans]XP_041564662.1 uncharacterized protein LOC121467350 [Drosophila elegans]XP_041564663.1 uncharacterized protein LOC121467351 [Drosophila elegans]XP_041564664.1 uncharacterized protein LOC121467351 [Drosophila elegans]XP_041564665.1 uncharacterized protein LOC121467351 [Drosophila elegans]XP_041564666.1 uncharacterized protein LOC121467351 [Drosophila elegans]XP_041564667.1 uncharacterized protein LOC121467351 [Drosophila elegans]XP_0
MRAGGANQGCSGDQFFSDFKTTRTSGRGGSSKVSSGQTSCRAFSSTAQGVQRCRNWSVVVNSGIISSICRFDRLSALEPEPAAVPDSADEFGESGLALLLFFGGSRFRSIESSTKGDCSQLLESSLSQFLCVMSPVWPHFCCPRQRASYKGFENAWSCSLVMSSGRGWNNLVILFSHTRSE